MSRLLTTVLVVLFASAAYAGGNPDVRAYFDFDPPNYVHAAQPAPYTSVDVYLCIDHLGEGVTSVSLSMVDPAESCPSVIIAASWTDLFPGGLVPNFPWPYGHTVFSSECITSDPALVGRVSFFYLGGSCCLEILDHPDYPRWVVDCSEPGEIDAYCVLAHASIGGADCPAGDCESVPVESETWGTIKSLYR